MRVRYEIIVVASADGMVGPLHVVEEINRVLSLPSGLHNVKYEGARFGAVYAMAQDVQKSVDRSREERRSPGSSPGPARPIHDSEGGAA